MRTELADAKCILRKRVLELRAALSTDARAAMSAAVTARIAALRAFQAADTVLAYASFGTELDTSALLRSTLANGRTLVLPRVDRTLKALVLHRVRDLATCLRPGVFGIREPDPDRCPVADPRSVTFALVPGVAFSASGARMGYGAGYYDRLLPQLASGVARVAGAFSVQLVEVVPMGPHDVYIDRIVTELGEYVRS